MLQPSRVIFCSSCIDNPSVVRGPGTEPGWMPRSERFGSPAATEGRPIFSADDVGASDHATPGTTQGPPGACQVPAPWVTNRCPRADRAVRDRGNVNVMVPCADSASIAMDVLQIQTVGAAPLAEDTTSRFEEPASFPVVESWQPCRLENAYWCWPARLAAKTQNCPCTYLTRTVASRVDTCT